MTANKRIFLNIVATYGRSLYALVIGLCCGRWTLMVLGEVDYGLMGLISGLTSFITVFSNLMAAAVGRFYAFSVGEANRAGHEAEGLENCRKWFNTALALYTVVPLVLMLIGWPLGEHAVKHWLTIPLDRVQACVWCFRFVCVGCFVGMASVPFTAMYGAKQYIAELTIYGVFSSTCNVVVLYYMLKHPGVWLTKFMLMQMLIGLLPQIIIVLRAYKLFPECKVCPKYMLSWSRLLQLTHFAFWRFFGDIGYLIKSQGIAILINKMFGPRMNASMAVGQTVASQTDTLATAMNGAFSPAITNLAGEGAKERMLAMAYRSCKFGALLNLLFVLPLSLEIHAIMTLWLKDPPPLAAEVCLLTLATIAIDETGRGIGISVTANGKLALYFSVLGGLNIISLPIAWLVVWSGIGQFLSVFIVLLVLKIVTVFLSVVIAERIVGLSAKLWVRTVFLPITALVVVSLSVGLFPRLLIVDHNILRLFVTAGVVLAAYIPCAWFFIFSKEERCFFITKFERFIKRH